MHSLLAKFRKSKKYYLSIFAAIGVPLISIPACSSRDGGSALEGAYSQDVSALYEAYSGLVTNPVFLKKIEDVLDESTSRVPTNLTGSTVSIMGVEIDNVGERLNLLQRRVDKRYTPSFRSFLKHSGVLSEPLSKNDFQLSAEYLVDILKSAKSKDAERQMMTKYTSKDIFKAMRGIAVIRALTRQNENSASLSLSGTGKPSAPEAKVKLDTNFGSEISKPIDSAAKGIQTTSHAVGAEVQCGSLVKACNTAGDVWQKMWKDLNSVVDIKNRCILSARPVNECNYGIARSPSKKIAGKSNVPGLEGQCSNVTFTCDCTEDRKWKKDADGNEVYKDGDTGGCSHTRDESVTASNLTLPNEEVLKQCFELKAAYEACTKRPSQTNSSNP